MTRERQAKRAQKVRPHQRFAALARRLTPRNVRVVFHDNGNFGQAREWKREIYVPRPTSADRLQIYFHELGHVLNWRRDDREWWSPSESEYRAEAFSVRTMRIHGIPWSPTEKKAGVAYVGWYVVNDLLHDGQVSAEARAFVGLNRLDDTTIIIAHILAVQRVSYPPKPTTDREYWSALLASVPNARMQRNQPGFHLIRIDPSKPRGPENIAWSRWPESGPLLYPVPTEAEIEQQEAIKQAMIDCGEWDTDDYYFVADGDEPAALFQRSAR
jgi:hypothetical protein